MRPRILALLACLLPAARCQTVQLFQWKNVNTQGMGYVTGLVVQPESPFDVYIRTDVGGAYRFDRPSSSWIPILDGIITQGGIGTESVAIDPNTPGRAYVVIPRVNSIVNNEYQYSGEVMVSEDRGVTWRATGLAQSNVYIGPNDDYRVESGERLAVDPNNSNVLYFASRQNGLWQGLRQSNAQYTWAPVSGGLPPWTTSPSADPAGYTFVLYDSRTTVNGVSQTVYAGVHGSAVWRSADGGQTWTNLGGNANPVRGVVASDGTLYVSCGVTTAGTGSVERYANGQWTDITPGDKSAPYTGITADPTNPATVMVGRNNYVWRSTNAGTAWSQQIMLMNAPNPLDSGSNPSAPPYYISTAGASGGMAALFIDPSNDQQVWWTNGWGVALTANVTASPPVWAWQMQNLEELVGVMVRVPPKPKASGGADVISMVEDMIGFRHASRDQVPTSKINPSGVPFDPNPSFSWQTPEYGGTTYPVPWPNVSMGASLDYSYYQPDNLAFVGNGEWQAWSLYGSSSDNGVTWKAFAAVPSEQLWSGGVQQLSTPVSGEIAMSSTNPLNLVWAPAWGTFDGAFDTASGANAPWPHYTTDGGKTWNLCMLANPPAMPNPYDPQNNNDVHYDALPKSWAIGISPYVTSNIVSADRNDPNGTTFYYWDNTFFYYSTNGGATWTASAATGFPSDITSVTIASNPAVYGDVWMAFARNGCCGTADVNGNPLYHSTDGGMTFQTVAGVDICDKIAFGMGNAAQTPFIYILGRTAGALRDYIYKSQDGGQTWIQITNPDTQAMLNVAQMEGDMRTPNLLYLAVAGRGIWYGTLPATAPPAPSFTANGVTNGASFADALTRGAVATIFGVNMAPAGSAAEAAFVPLPTSLNGVMVSVDSFPAPLWYVSPGQINFQIPWDAALSGTSTIQIYNGLGVSSAVPVPLAPYAPGIFQYSSESGAAEGVITHADYSLVTAADPAAPGEEIIVWMTGFGDVAVIPDTGFGTPLGVTATLLPTATLSGAPITVNYAGLTYGAIGLAQVAVTLPATLPAGNPLSLVVTAGGVSSQSVSLWVEANP
jgi:xyloglucan-specific exo-beta-1,4-glucanase